ncbi:hypothetical protein EON64_07845 [archaeon]|nr:MAG: hypothetical protein EON64_07845 [archaeon]
MRGSYRQQSNDHLWIRRARQLQLPPRPGPGHWSGAAGQWGAVPGRFTAPPPHPALSPGCADWQQRSSAHSIVMLATQEMPWQPLSRTPPRCAAVSQSYGDQQGRGGWLSHRVDDTTVRVLKGLCCRLSRPCGTDEAATTLESLVHPLSEGTEAIVCEALRHLIACQLSSMHTSLVGNMRLLALTAASTERERGRSEGLYSKGCCCSRQGTQLFRDANPAYSALRFCIEKEKLLQKLLQV